MRIVDPRPMPEVLADLPAFCFCRHATTGEPVLLKRGVVGYWPTHDYENVEEFNATHGITAAQVDAMEAGSHFGFHVPAADPLMYPDLVNACWYPADLIAKWNARTRDAA